MTTPGPGRPPISRDVPVGHTTRRSIPVLFDFDYSNPQGLGQFDPESGELTLRVRKRSRVWDLLAGAGEDGVVVAFTVRPHDPEFDPRPGQASG